MAVLCRLFLAAGIAAALVTSGCGPRRFANENDVLRARVLELETEAAALEKRIVELEAELAARTSPPDPATTEIAANTPHVAAITIDRLSHVRDDDRDGTPDTLIVYVRPVDGRERFVQFVGRLSLHAALLPADDESMTIARVELSPGEVRDAHRSSVMGTHYTIEAPLALPPGAAGFAECTVHVIYEDGRTGQSFEEHSAIALR